MMEERTDQELRSPEVRKILDTPPGWTVRNGIWAVSAMICLMLIFSWFYKYPEIVRAKFIMLSENPSSNGQNINLKMVLILPEPEKIAGSLKVALRFEDIPGPGSGVLVGRITSVSKIPSVTPGRYSEIADVLLDTGSVRDHGRTIHFTGGMKGSAKIVIREKRLLRILVPFPDSGDGRMLTN